MSSGLVVDAHHHFWPQPRPELYPWLTEPLAGLRRPFGPDDLRPLLEAAGVDRTVLVQTRSSLDESIDLLATAAGSGFVAGVVAWVDLTDPEVRRAIARLRAAPGGERLVGIRHQARDEADAGWLARAEVHQGLAAVAEAGLAYDLLVRTPQLPAAVAAARAHPSLRFVIDHLAKPGIAAGPEDLDWAAGMMPFADLPNVSCKLSGMVTEADWAGWQPADLQPYVDRVYSWFGEDRLLYGSDWPVCLVAADYGRVMDTLHQLLSGRSEEARRKVFGANAMRIYSL